MQQVIPFLEQAVFSLEADQNPAEVLHGNVCGRRRGNKKEDQDQHAL